MIVAYGWPNGQSQTGVREILTYSQGQITLVDGRVTQVDFSPSSVWPTPKPKPSASTPKKARVAVSQLKALPPVDYWSTDFAEVTREAKARHARILAVFTGSDWSPASRRFHDEVEMRTDFVSAVLTDFVLLRLDFPAHGNQRPELRAQNALLRERCRVTTYPTLLILSARGDQLAMIDLSKLDPAQPAGDQVLAVLDQVQQLQQSKIQTREAASADPAIEQVEEVSNPWVEEFLALVLLIWLWIRHHRSKIIAEVESHANPTSTHVLIPTPALIAVWSHARLREVCAAVFEVEGFHVKPRLMESGADLALHRGRETKPEVLVLCHPGTVGLAGAKMVRELLGTIVVENVDAGWVVSPGGFTAEARQVAIERGLVLIDGEQLLQRLAEVPQLARSRLLGRDD